MLSRGDVLDVKHDERFVGLMETAILATVRGAGDDETS